jgi:hypothetical protein
VSCFVNVHVYWFHFPSLCFHFKKTCSDGVWLQVHMGDVAATPSSFRLFGIIRIASFLQISNLGIAVSFFPCTQVCTAFTSATNKRKVIVLIGPPFCCPNFFQTNWVLTTIVDVINPVLCAVVMAEGLCILKLFPHAAHEPPRPMVLNLVQDPMH